MNRSNMPSLTRKRGGRTSSVRDPHKLAGSSTHDSLHTEPSFVKLHASHAQTSEGLPHEYNPKGRPSRGRRILTGKGTKGTQYCPEPLDYGPNYKHTLAKHHFAEGGHTTNPNTGHPGYGFLDGFLDWSKAHPNQSLMTHGPYHLPALVALHAASGMWIQHALQHPGSLHKALKVPKGQKISGMKLEKATHSRSPLTRKRANLALTLKGFHHKG